MQVGVRLLTLRRSVSPGFLHVNIGKQSSSAKKTKQKKTDNDKSFLLGISITTYKCNCTNIAVT